MNNGTNRTDSSGARQEDLIRRLDEMNEMLSSISAKEVLFIIVLTFLAIFAAFNMCLLVLERRKKKKQNSVPSSIVIQPNNAAKPENKSKKGKNEKTKMTSSGYEKDVLPSKTMKIKVAISPNMSIAKKGRSVHSKESTTEETSKTDPSQTEKSIIKKPVPPLPTTPLPLLPPPESAASADVTTAVEPTASIQSIAPIPAAGSSTVAPLVPVVPAPIAAPYSAPGPILAPKTGTSSQSNESMTSFTAPEEGSSASRIGILNQKGVPPPSTPTATTLSGVSSSASQLESIKSTDVTTAKDLTQAKSPAVRTPDIPLNPSTPPPTSDKKI